jgi:hypothetical protein
MAHSGLISLTSAISYPGNGNFFSPFTMKLAGKDNRGMPNTFGDALVDQYNIGAYIIPLSLMGAGTLRADSTAYVPFGALEIKLTDQQITGTFNHTYPDTLVWLENFNVTATGNYTVVAKEVRIYAESDLKGEVHITVSN